MVETGRRDGKAHAAEFGDDALSTLKNLAAQPAAEPALLIDYRFQAEFHQFVGRNDAGQAAADHRDLAAHCGSGQMAETGWMVQPFVIGKREIRTERCNGRRWLGAFRTGAQNAESPVMPRPRISACTSCAPS